jgi:Domain of unknown function (DUF4340)
LAADKAALRADFPFMKRRHIGVLLLLVIILGGAGLILQKQNQSQWSESAAPESGKILDFPVNDVAQVEIRSATGEVHLEKKNGVWVVAEKGEYPADFQRVSALIRQLWELRPVQQIKVGPSQFGRLELTEPGQGANAQPAAASQSDARAVGTVVDLKNENDKTLAKIIVGKRVMAKQNDQEILGRFSGVPIGRYVVAASNGGNASVVNQRLEVDAQPQSWLKHDFIKIENPESISLAGQTAPKHWILTRSDAKADWKLADARQNEELNKSITGSFSPLLTSLRFTDVLPPDVKPEENGLDKLEVLSIQTFDRFKYTLKIGKPASDAYPVAVSVAADPAKERTPSAEEKPEDKAKLDAQFKNRLQQLEEKAASEKECEKRIYLVPKSSLDPFLKDRANLLAKPSASPTISPTPQKKH